MRPNSSLCQVRTTDLIAAGSFNDCFAASVLEDTGNKAWVEMDKRWLNEQKEEFREMDEDHDGVLIKEELMVNEVFPSLTTRV